MIVRPEKQEALKRRMEELGINEDELREQFVLGSGKGGQKQNKTASCVQLKHEPTGLEVKCQQSRSRELNRYLARVALCDKLEEKLLGEKSKKQQAYEKIRRQKRRRSRKAKEKMLEGKRIQSEKKSLRQKPKFNGDS